MGSAIPRGIYHTATNGFVAFLLFSLAGSPVWAAPGDAGQPAAPKKAPAKRAAQAVGTPRVKRDSDREIARHSKVLAKDPNNAAALLGRGKAYVARRDYASALADYDHAAQVAPQSKKAWYGRAAVRQLLQEQTARSLPIPKPTKPTALLDGGQFDDDGAIRSHVPSSPPPIVRR